MLEYFGRCRLIQHLQSRCYSKRWHHVLLNKSSAQLTLLDCAMSFVFTIELRSRDVRSSMTSDTDT